MLIQTFHFLGGGGGSKLYFLSSSEVSRICELFFPPQSRALQIISLFMNTTQKAEGNELPAVVLWYSPIPTLQLVVTARNTGFFYSKHKAFISGRKDLNAVMPLCPASGPGVRFLGISRLVCGCGKITEWQGKYWKTLEI